MFLRTKSGLVHFGNCEAIHWYSSQGIGSRHCSVKCPLFWWHLPGSVVFSCRSAVPSLFSTGLVILEICFVYYPPVRSQQITVNCSLYTIPIHLVNLNREIYYYYCIQMEKSGCDMGLPWFCIQFHATWTKPEAYSKVFQHIRTLYLV